MSRVEEEESAVKTPRPDSSRCTREIDWTTKHAFGGLPTLALVVAGIAVGRPLSAQTGPVCGHTAEDSLAVRRVAEGIVQADNRRDLDAVLGFYSPDAVLHPPGEPPVRGRAAIRPRYEALFSGFDPAIVPELESVELCGSMAVVSGRNGGILRGRDSEPDRALSDAFVMILGKAEGRWSISRLIWHPDRS